MAVTLEQVQRLLDSDEPDYAAAAKLGSQILPHLNVLVQSPDPGLAAKAASLASLVDHAQAVEVLRAAARHASPLVRVAAAAGLGNLQQPAAAGVLMALLDDKDGGVRGLALKSAAARPNAALLAKIADLGKRDPAAHVRTLAANIAGSRRA